MEPALCGWFGSIHLPPYADLHIAHNQLFKPIMKDNFAKKRRFRLVPAYYSPRQAFARLPKPLIF
jgi:hypothetical protein